MSSDDRDLVRRLLEGTSDATAPPAPRHVEPPPTQKDPEGATFLLHDDDWDETGGRAALSHATATASSVGRQGRALAGPALRHVARLAIFALAVIGAAAGLAVAWIHLTTDPLADVHAYYNAAARLNAGQPLYPPGIDPSTNLAYLYPPLLAIVLRPLALLGYGVFALVWEGIVVLSFVGLVWKLGVRSQRTWLAIGILGIPIGWALAVAQAQVPLTLLLAIGQPWSIALATNVKLFPALVALWWLGRRDFEATFAFAIWTGLLAVAQWLIEPAASALFLRTVGLSQVGEVRNISPYAISLQLWVVLFVVGAAITLALARTRWGWPAAVALSTLASPRLLVYMLMSLIAGIREPEVAKLPAPEPRPWQHVVGARR